MSADAGRFDAPAWTISISPFEPSPCSTVDSIPTDAFDASRTTAPAPSPKSTQVVRSFQLRSRDSRSAPITSAFWIAPETIMPRAIASAVMKLVQAASTSKAPARVAPISVCTRHAVAGKR